jgi:hypothetical protein
MRQLEVVPGETHLTSGKPALLTIGPIAELTFAEGGRWYDMIGSPVRDF